VCDNQQTLGLQQPGRQESLLLTRIGGILDRHSKRIAKNRRRFIE